jgi:hypothetical protein
MLKENRPNMDIYCHNCGYPLHGDENFCPYCSQKNDIRPLSIKIYFQTFIGNFFNLDNRIWQTLINLIKHPGAVALQYIQGKRKKYSNPFKLLLQLGIVYFLILGISDKLQISGNKFIKIDFINDPISLNNQNISRQIDSINQQIHFVSILKNDSIDFQTRNKIYNLAYHKIIHTDLDKKNIVNHNIYSELEKFLLKKGIDTKYYLQLENLDEFEKKTFSDKISELIEIINETPYNHLDNKTVMNRLHIQNNLTNKLAIIFSRKMYNLFNTDGQTAFKKNFMSKITIGLFFVLPIFGFFVWLLYHNKNLSYTDTLVWIFYVQNVFFILLLADLILGIIPFVSNISLLIYIWFVYYLARTIKHIYQENYFKTLIKLFLYIIPVYLISANMGLLIIPLILLLF